MENVFTLGFMGYNEKMEPVISGVFPRFTHIIIPISGIEDPAFNTKEEKSAIYEILQLAGGFRVDMSPEGVKRLSEAKFPAGEYTDPPNPHNWSCQEIYQQSIEDILNTSK